MLGGGMRSWTNCFFSFNMIFLPKMKSKRCERNTESSNTQGFELHRPSSKGNKLLLVKVIKAIFIIIFKLFISNILFSVTHSLAMTEIWLSIIFTDSIILHNTICIIICSGNLHHAYISSHIHIDTDKRRHTCVTHIQAQTHTYTRVK